mmetsp:Transcript_5765/g.16695  ORF Transcript_5765/g.16695 Transcript_5765/m.16695 type:complete len:333 (+) Transcript_5765:68-1066(+)
MASSLRLLFFPGLVAARSAPIAVFGHKAPDTDAVTSALVYAWELNERNVPALAYRLGDLNPETTYVLQKVGVAVPPLLPADPAPKTPVAVVDTNNPEELPRGIGKAHIHSIVDHHKLSGLANSEPLEIDMRPLCSATSILYARAKAANLTPPKHVAGLMLAGILSDSLEFRSPTTTPTDKEHATELAQLAGLDVHEFASGMFDAKGKVDHLTAKQLLMMDSKVFTLGGKKLRVSVLETTKPAAPLARKAELVTAMQQLVAEEKLDDLIFFVVDILQESATFVSGSPYATSLVEKAWKVRVDRDSGTVLLPGVMSRKKQMIPKLETAVANAEL